MTLGKPWVFATKPVPECAICSNHLFSVCHPHITSLTSYHGRQVGDITSLLLGSSTLHNVWKSHKFKPKFLTDHDCIIGGQVHDCHASFLHQLVGWSGQLNVVLACGVNNVSTKDSASDIIFQLKSLVASIKYQNAKNKIVIASLLFAPKYCDSRLPRQKNMLHKVREVNSWIEQFNKEESGLMLDLGRRGVEGDPMQGSSVVHKYQDWRENVVERKLHLQQEVKDDIARELVDVFTSMRQLY
eukprot:TRINITY_DN10266_c0_g1_i1.p1 TRINITY_DN10266_c0_g1~~TRINITY_DN10266_c0_g1_i1.p1  ORF type:complete len:243 (-),score=77.16 TRINITY_DN10266_c0_g1_i1:102-830(-)